MYPHLHPCPTIAMNPHERAQSLSRSLSHAHVRVRAHTHTHTDFRVIQRNLQASVVCIRTGMINWLD